MRKGDKTWVNTGRSSAKIWTDQTVKYSKETFLEGLSIVLHIGNEDCFVEGRSLLFESKIHGELSWRDGW
jgi:hypothetical protein